MTRRQPFSTVQSVTAIQTEVVAEGLDRPVPAVPVPGHAAVEAGRLVEQGRAPEDEVGADEALLHTRVEAGAGRSGISTPGGVAPDVLHPGAGDMRRGHRLVVHVRVVGDEPGGEGLKKRDPVRRQPELGDQYSLRVKGGDLRF